MANPDPPLPSLKAVVAFEAVVRLGSMTAAANELGSTQPAVSQRIRALEEALGVPLFDRGARRLQPTRHGRDYYEDIAGPLRRMIGATRRLQARAYARHHGLVLAVHFGFAHRWLLPRIGRLEAAFPGTEIEVFPVDRDEAPEMASADLTVRFGRFDRCGGQEWPLFHEAVFPVCSPGCASGYALDGRVDSSSLARVPLLHMDEHSARWLDWKRWCELAGLESPMRSSRFHYNNYPLVLNAAVEGRGLALGWAGLVEAMIEEGTLVRLAPTVTRREYGYILGARHCESAIVAAVVDWFRRNAAGGQPR